MIVLDFLGTLASASATLLYISMHRSAWLLTLLATTLNGYLYWKKGIYAGMLLELVYFISAFYGWFYWKQSREKPYTGISGFSTARPWLLLIGTLFVLYNTLLWFLSAYTPTTVPHLDAITTSLSLIAQWLMCRKIIVSWILWFFTDLIYAYLYYIKDLPLHTALMIFYTGLAVLGYLHWRKQQKASADLHAVLSTKSS